ncbi:hypothetical protein [Nocardia tenerifensis]|nr:hypothetical protein [Nocardia tenerifensis]
MLIVVAVNIAAAVASTGFGVVGLVRPSALIAGEQPTPGMSLYAYFYGVRAIPLGVMTVVALAVGDQRVSVAALIVSGVVQAADSALGVRRRVAGMALSAGILAIVHLLSAAWLLGR